MPCACAYACDSFAFRRFVRSSRSCSAKHSKMLP